MQEPGPDSGTCALCTAYVLSVASDRIRMLLLELMHVSVSKEQLMALDLSFSERCRNLGKTQEPAFSVALNLLFQ